MYLGVRVEAPLVSRKNSFGCVEFSATMRTVKKDKSLNIPKNTILT
jgi:hypothetical protein